MTATPVKFPGRRKRSEHQLRDAVGNHVAIDTHTPGVDQIPVGVDGDPFPDDHSTGESHDRCVVGESLSDHPNSLTDVTTSAGDRDYLPAAATLESATISAALLPELPSAQPTPAANTSANAAVAEPLNGEHYWHGLRLLAETHYDLQQQRIAIQHRERSAPINYTALTPLHEQAAAVEHQAGLHMKREFRKSGFRAWMQDQPGVGEQLLARLLGSIGDPAVRTHADGTHTWRTLAQLRSLCGHGDPNRRRRKGMTQDEAFACGKPLAKMLVHLIAESATKEPGRSAERWRETGEWGDGVPKRQLRAIYEQRREHTANRGDWTDAHKHNDALRIVGKHFLRLLHAEAMRLHEEANTTGKAT